MPTVEFGNQVASSVIPGADKFSTREGSHILTVSLEDYFQVLTFRKLISPKHWNRFETRLEDNTLRVLDLLDEYRAHATFFVVGWTAERRPDLIREVARRGHELANKGYHLNRIRTTSPRELADNLARGRDAIEQASGRTVVGCRIPLFRFGLEHLWVLDTLAAQGYQYDSSMVPSFWSFPSEPWRRFIHQHQFQGKTIWEVPLSTYPLWGCNLPICGGNYVRQMPSGLVGRLAERWTRESSAPLVMYFHVWELDPHQVRIDGAPRLARIRHYRNLEKTAQIWETYLSRYRFMSVAEHLEIATKSVSVESEAGAAVRAGAAAFSHSERSRIEVQETTATPVSVVVPCHNEELALPYLANTLRSVVEALDGQYDFRFLFVDDGSTDRTHDLLSTLFGGWPGASILKHEQNRGVAAAIMTGIRNAATEIVCTIDCDCTYDPHMLKEMIPDLSLGVDVVTASPYHPEGRVKNVPRWRLALSKLSALLYRRVLRQKLYTYTSCCRVYRRSAVQDLSLWNDSFIGIAEILGRLDLRQARIVERPATLDVRLIGRSKMRVVKVAAGHLCLMARLLLARLRGGPETKAIQAPLPSSDRVFSERTRLESRSST